jgi:hypothetical protein
MAGKKIIQLPSLGRALQSTDIFEVSDNGNGSYKVAATEIGPAPSQYEIPDITHDGNQDTGIPVPNFVLTVQPEFYTFVSYPSLNISELYSYKLSNYTAFSFLYDTYSYSYPSNITVNNEAVLFTSIQMLGQQINYSLPNCEFFGGANLNGVGQIDLPNCVAAKEIQVNGNPVISIDAPELIWVRDSLSFSENIDTINFPKLELVGSLQGFNINWIGMNPVLSLPALKYITSSVYLSGLQNVHTIDMSNVKVINSEVYIDNAYSLTSLQMPNLRFLGADYTQRRFIVYNAPLNQSSVDSILTSLDASNQYNGEVNLAGLCQTPSATGQAAAVSLMNKGWSVSTN